MVKIMVETKTEYSPYIRVKIETRERWEPEKLKAQAKINQQLTNDEFANLLLIQFNNSKIQIKEKTEVKI
jgi:hypothetical protein